MVYKNVAKIREAKGVTKTHIANALDLSLQGYRYLESGETTLGVERLKIISSVLGVPVSVFFDDELTETVIDEIQSRKEVS